MSHSIASLIEQAAAYNASLPEPQPQPELPEFAFSPHEGYWRTIGYGLTQARLAVFPDGMDDPANHYERPWSQPIHIIDVSPIRECSRRPTRPEGVKRELPPEEEGWLNGKAFFKAPVEPKVVQPIGTTKPLEGLGRFLNRLDEIAAIAATQDLELPTLVQEFAANGLSATSLSSSNDDDDLDAANIAERHVGFVPYTPDLLTVAAQKRRFDWEKQILYSSSSTRIYAKVKIIEEPATQAVTGYGQAKLVLACNNKTWTHDQILAHADTIRELVAGRTAEELSNDRERAGHYGAVVASLMHPHQRQTAQYKRYIDFADDDRARVNYGQNEVLALVPDIDNPGGMVTEWITPTGDGGPEELGLHQFEVDYHGTRIQSTFDPGQSLWSSADHHPGFRDFDAFLKAESSRAARASFPY